MAKVKFLVRTRYQGQVVTPKSGPVEVDDATAERWEASGIAKREAKPAKKADKKED